MLPGNFKLVSIMTYLRALAPHARPERATVDITSLFDVLNPEMVSTSLAWTVLSIATACFVLMALVVFSVKEYVPKDDAL